MNVRVFPISVFVLFVFCANVPETGLSAEPTTSGSNFVKRVNGGFKFVKNAGIQYILIYALHKKLPGGAKYSALFENLSPGEKPVTIDGRVPASSASLVIKSPLFPAAANNRSYTVKLTVRVGDELVGTYTYRARLSQSSEWFRASGVQEL